jgi:hypothetical protein
MYFQVVKDELDEIGGHWKTHVVPERNKLGSSTLPGFVEEMIADRIQSKKLIILSFSEGGFSASFWKTRENPAELPDCYTLG